MIHVSLALPAWGAEQTQSGAIRVVAESMLALTAPAASVNGSTLHLDLTAILLEDAGWQAAEVQRALADALPILAQCGVAARQVKLLRVATPALYRNLSPQGSRLLAAHLAPVRPAVFFVRDTRMRPAFDAEAFGLGNTRTRPELAHTVWVTRSAPDLPETLAHELFHVIANTGEHSDDAANLMHERTAPQRRQLTPRQCASLRETGLKNRLLRE